MVFRPSMTRSAFWTYVSSSFVSKAVGIHSTTHPKCLSRSPELLSNGQKHKTLLKGQREERQILYFQRLVVYIFYYNTQEECHTLQTSSKNQTEELKYTQKPYSSKARFLLLYQQLNKRKTLLEADIVYFIVSVLQSSLMCLCIGVALGRLLMEVQTFSFELEIKFTM